MRSFTIKNTGLFMTGLLSDKEKAFDQFLLSEAVIVTGNTYTIDGHINRDFYNDDELEAMRAEAEGKGRIFSEEMIRWESAKHFCFDFIRGRKLPLSLKITFHLAPENIDRFLSSGDYGITREQINSLNVNIKFSGAALTCTTATSLKIFTMDKSLENAFDDMFGRFLDTHGYDWD